MPSYSTHLLQPLDIGRFSALKRAYGTRVAEYMRSGINHIDKVEFLNAFSQAQKEAQNESNIRSGFEATGPIPYDPDQALFTLLIRPCTPTQLSDAIQEQWQPETPHISLNLSVK